MMPNFLCLFLLGSFLIYPEEKLMDTPLSMRTYVRLEKNDSIYQNRYKTYTYSEFKPLNKILLDILLAERPSKYVMFPENTCTSDTLTNEEIRNRLGFKVYRHIVNDEDGNELYTEVLQTVIEDTSAIRFIMGFDEEWSFDSNTLRFEKNINNIKLIRKFVDEDSQKVRESSVAVIPNSKENSSLGEKVAAVTYEHPLLIPMDWVTNDTDTDFLKRMDHAGLLNYSLVYANENFISSRRSQFIQEIFENGFNEKLKIIDYYSRKPLARKEIIDRLSNINAFLPSGDIYECEIDSGTLDSEIVDALIFCEDWYFDPKSISFSKHVREISFVQYYYDESDLYYSKPQRNILFTVLFE